MAHEAPEQRTQQARAAIRRFPWGSIVVAVACDSTIGLFGAPGIAPLLLAILGKQIAEGTVVAWLSKIGGNVLAG